MGVDGMEYDEEDDRDLCEGLFDDEEQAWEKFDAVVNNTPPPRLGYTEHHGK